MRPVSATYDRAAIAEQIVQESILEAGIPGSRDVRADGDVGTDYRDTIPDHHS
jgi:hypothetical protein